VVAIFYIHSGKKLLGGIRLVRKRCPNCLNEYDTVLKRKRLDVSAQVEFPGSEPWQREQLISGICSDRCWDEFIGGGM